MGFITNPTASSLQSQLAARRRAIEEMKFAASESTNVDLVPTHLGVNQIEAVENVDYEATELGVNRNEVPVRLTSVETELSNSKDKNVSVELDETTPHSELGYVNTNAKDGFDEKRFDSIDEVDNVALNQSAISSKFEQHVKNSPLSLDDVNNNGVSLLPVLEDTTVLGKDKLTPVDTLLDKEFTSSSTILDEPVLIEEVVDYDSTELANEFLQSEREPVDYKNDTDLNNPAVSTIGGGEFTTELNREATDNLQEQVDGVETELSLKNNNNDLALDAAPLTALGGDGKLEVPSYAHTSTDTALDLETPPTQENPFDNYNSSTSVLDEPENLSVPYEFEPEEVQIIEDDFELVDANGNLNTTLEAIDLGPVETPVVDTTLGDPVFVEEQVEYGNSDLDDPIFNPDEIDSLDTDLNFANPSSELDPVTLAERLATDLDDPALIQDGPVRTELNLNTLTARDLSIETLTDNQYRTLTDLNDANLTTTNRVFEDSEFRDVYGNGYERITEPEKFALKENVIDEFFQSADGLLFLAKQKVLAQQNPVISSLIDNLPLDSRSIFNTYKKDGAFVITEEGIYDKINDLLDSNQDPIALLRKAMEGQKKEVIPPVPTNENKVNTSDTRNNEEIYKSMEKELAPEYLREYDGVSPEPWRTGVSNEEFIKDVISTNDGSSPANNGVKNLHTDGKTYAAIPYDKFGELRDDYSLGITDKVVPEIRKNNPKRSAKIYGLAPSDGRGTSKFVMTSNAIAKTNDIYALAKNPDFTGDKMNALDYSMSFDQKNLYTNGIQDYISFYITGGMTRPGKSGLIIPFRASLKGMPTDSHNASWNAISIMGRPDKAYIYEGYDRTVGFDFTVAAQSRSEMPILWRKINLLCSFCAPDFSAERPVGQIARITIGNLFQNTPMIINSVTPTFYEKWDTGYTDEGDNETGKEAKQLPMSVDISVSCTYIGDYRPQFNGRFYSISPNGANSKNGNWLYGSSV